MWKMLEMGQGWGGGKGGRTGPRWRQYLCGNTAEEGHTILRSCSEHLAATMRSSE